MALKDLTRESVLAAIHEFDGVGRDAFLDQYGFGRSRNFLVLHDGVAYDSKAICGAAHGHLDDGGAPLKPGDFSGGEATVASRLEALGFVVVRDRPRLALVGVGGEPLKATLELRPCPTGFEITLHSRGGGVGSPQERNPDYFPALDLLLARLAKHNAVLLDVFLDSQTVSGLRETQRRLVPGCPMELTGADLGALRSEITSAAAVFGKAEKTGGNPTKQILLRFAANDLGSLAAATELVVGVPSPLSSYPEESLAGLPEGARTQVTVNRYERNPANRRVCIEAHGAACAVCEMNFATTYGGLGEGFIHVHHKNPVSQARELQTIDPVNDLVPVCPNCHAMLHFGSPDAPRTVNELKARYDAA